MIAERRVAVVVATHNRASSLLEVLARLTALPERPPVVVVDNGSSDGTTGAVRRRFPDVAVLELAENRGPAARTLGVRVADVPYVAFADDDSWWAPGALTTAGDLLDRHPRVALLAARILVGEEEREDRTSVEMARSPLVSDVPLPGPRVLGFVACGAVVRRSAFLAVGGFDPRFAVGGEERLLAVDLEAAGWRLAYVPEVVAHHHPSPSRNDLQRRRAEVRNELWFAWLRRPSRSALRTTATFLRAGVRDAAVRRGLLSAARGIRWVARERNPVGRELELDLRAVTEI